MQLSFSSLVASVESSQSREVLSMLGNNDENLSAQSTRLWKHQNLSYKLLSWIYFYDVNAFFSRSLRNHLIEIITNEGTSTMSEREAFRA